MHLTWDEIIIPTGSIWKKNMPRRGKSVQRSEAGIRLTYSRNIVYPGESKQEGNQPRRVAQEDRELSLIMHGLQGHGEECELYSEIMGSQ